VPPSCCKTSAALAAEGWSGDLATNEEHFFAKLFSRAENPSTARTLQPLFLKREHDEHLYSSSSRSACLRESENGQRVQTATQAITRTRSRRLGIPGERSTCLRWRLLLRRSVHGVHCRLPAQARYLLRLRLPSLPLPRNRSRPQPSDLRIDPRPRPA